MEAAMRISLSLTCLPCLLAASLPVAAKAEPSLSGIINESRPGDATISYSGGDTDRGVVIAKLRQREFAEAVPLLLKLADAGESWAMRELGWLYAEGNGVPVHSARALGWFYEAAIIGDSRSMLLVGVAFSRGWGVDPDQGLAAFWLAKARDSGDRHVAGAAADELRRLAA